MYRNALDTVLTELNDDRVHLFEITTYLKADGVSSEKMMPATLQLISEAMKKGNIVIGQFNNENFHVWEVSPEEALKRIEKEWKELKRPLNIADICWLEKK